MARLENQRSETSSDAGPVARHRSLDATSGFTTSATQYTTWEVTLYGVAGGNVGSEQVGPADLTLDPVPATMVLARL